ncbi:MAG: sarcosine oxidase subunit delta [Alphaproteobacteria bacterium]
MLLITCPHCGPREESEFACGGEAHIARPLVENSITDAEFADYLFLRDNPKGMFLERWRHTAGCRRWFNVARDTVSHDIIEIYAMGSLPRKAAAKAAYDNSWRRSSPAELAAVASDKKPAKKKAAAKKATAKKAASKKTADKKAAAKKALAKKAVGKTTTSRKAATKSPASGRRAK